MLQDRTFIERNRESRNRMQRMAERLSDAELQTRVGEHWTVAIVFAHLAFWDRRVLYVMDMTEQQGSVFIPEIDIFVNDLSLPLWAAVPPRQAVRIALETAEELDRRLETFDPQYIEEMLGVSKRWVNRWMHRGEHLDEADRALGE